MNMSTKPFDKEAAKSWEVILSKLNELRESGLTLDQIGKILGVANATVSRWLSRVQGGERNSFGEMVRYAKILGISPAEMFGEQEDRDPFEEKLTQEISENINLSGMTINQVADITNIDSEKLAGMLSGSLPLRIKDFYLICKAVGINPTIILNRSSL
ncbi:helix-turn-helix domain-containing protein [Maridesulfovibrio bastinii]|uniref:helix-turn-helix domain-containing protein n=1 Tax=Maridesulfovibrio bastinii TaxID=47157 RepID=UPI000480192D|nr:helix-turn-helix transcriptional regulator [Maridesulfovibrio bastinii]